MAPRPSYQSPDAPVPIMGNMNLDFLNELRPAPGPKFQAARVDFIGGQGYILNSFEATVRIRCFEGGFRIEFREPLQVPAEALLGNKAPWAYVTDTRVKTGGHELSLATLYPEWYPKKIRRGEVIGVT